MMVFIAISTLNHKNHPCEVLQQLAYIGNSDIPDIYTHTVYWKLFAKENACGFCKTYCIRKHFLVIIYIKKK